jgi:hypothetical protein
VLHGFDLYVNRGNRERRAVAQRLLGDVNPGERQQLDLWGFILFSVDLQFH